jgi:hypothetical protein
MPKYVTAAEVKAEGVPDSTSTALITRRINKWEQIVEQITRNIFVKTSPGELRFDGNDSSILHFSVPLVSVSSLKINNETVALPADEYVAYTGRGLPQDDRFNPKIELRPQTQSIFRRNAGLFVMGLDQLITADWGFVEADDSTPQMVKDAILELVILDLDGYFDKVNTGGVRPITAVRRERTDDHEIEYQMVENTRAVWSFLPKHISDMLALFRAPMAVNVPRQARFLQTHLLGLSIYEA